MKQRRELPIANLVGLDGPEVVVPWWAARWLEQRTDLTAKRIAARGQDIGIDYVLNKLHLVATWPPPGSGTDVGAAAGTRQPLSPEPDQHSEQLSTAQAAAKAMVTDRAIRRAIAEDRLRARKVAGRWVIQHRDLEQYAAERAARR